MQKIFLPLLLLVFSFNFSTAQKRLFDQPMIISQCNISITTKGLLATTWIELEFYNDKDKEEEGKYMFSLNPGQAITGFQLMLGDKYRDGSIEERWKARSAYGSVVGKRMDPALLQLISGNYYSLNIYPVPAKGSRKVKIRIEELLNEEEGSCHYSLDMLKKDSVGKLIVAVDANSYPYRPLINEGLLKGFTFNTNGNVYSGNGTYNNVAKPGAVEFTLPVAANENYKNAFIEPKSGSFFVKIKSEVPDSIAIAVKKLRVYWDCSASINDSDKLNFINYLTEVIKKYGPTQLTLVPFNHQLLGEKIFSQQQINDSAWQPFIQAIPQYGATQFGILNFSTDDDLILVFTDGKQTWGKKHTASVETPVVFITSRYNYNYYYNDYYDGYSGYGDYDDYFNKAAFKTYCLYGNNNAMSCLDKLPAFKTKLIIASDEHGNKIELAWPQKIYSTTIITGYLNAGSERLILQYGINEKVLQRQEIKLQPVDTLYDFNKLQALINYEEIMRRGYWYNTLAFGIDNKILTAQTAFIVLEKVEDYLKYDITPPDDLMQDCLDKGFVKHNYKQKFNLIKKVDEFDMLKMVSVQYNKRIALWADANNKINVDETINSYKDIQQSQTISIDNGLDKNTAIKVPPVNQVNSMETNNSKSMQEVVVIGYGAQNKRDVTGAISSIRQRQFRDMPVTNVAELLQGRVAGVEVIKSSGEPGSNAQISIRGASSLNNSEPLYVIDGMVQPHGVSGFFAGNNINPYDIDNITVLKDAAAASIYGASAAGGVILIKTKTGNSYGSYYQNTTLKTQEDVDYMQTIKNSGQPEKYQVYQELEPAYKKDMGFYMDMALYFYEQGLTQYIDEVLMKAAELSNSDFESQLSLAFLYEYMKQYDKAITVYQNLIEDYPNSLKLVRNLGWAYYESNRFDSAVKILYKGITANNYNSDLQTVKLKDIMLADMNMMIALHKTEVNTSYIPDGLIKPIVADMRVLVESNNSGLYNLSIKQPWKPAVVNNDSVVVNGQRLQIAANDYSLGEFIISHANNKKYSFSVPFYSYSWQGYVPTLIRIIKIKDFSKPTQSIDMDIINLDNQYGNIEFDDFKIKK